MITISEENQKCLLEAALFMAPHGMKFNELCALTNVAKDELIKILNELKQDYASKNSAIEITIFDDSASMFVGKQYADKVKHLAAKTELNKSIQKTLAMIAYKQPIKQSDVIKYRNNKAYDHVKELLEKGFITKEKAGRTFILKTTKKFVEYFGKTS